MDALRFLDEELQSLKDQGLYREPRTLAGRQRPRSVFDGKSVVNLFQQLLRFDQSSQDD